MSDIDTDELRKFGKAFADKPAAGMTAVGNRILAVCDALEAERQRADRLERERDHLKLQAGIHAQEARTANATTREIYQLCTGAHGEPGDWHGAEPVRQRLDRLERENERLREARNRADLDAEMAVECVRDLRAFWGRLDEYGPGVYEVLERAESVLDDASLQSRDEAPEPDICGTPLTDLTRCARPKGHPGKCSRYREPEAQPSPDPACSGCRGASVTHTCEQDRQPARVPDAVRRLPEKWRQHAGRLCRKAYASQSKGGLLDEAWGLESAADQLDQALADAEREEGKR